ncbi:MAG: nitroreductase family protein [Bacteroidia bacterium]|nr:nitroreductase family protein [Bacteroidia bacterium]
MTNEFYTAIFKRKSFHLFRNVGDEKLSHEELKGIEDAWNGFEALYPDIRTAIRIVPSAQVSIKRDSEYSILIYSEKKPNYLMNAGYLGEQLDLYLVNNGIGSLWYGLGKADEPGFDGLEYVIMITVHKVSDASLFREDMFKAKRKPLEEIWTGDTLGLAEIARFAPSACNSQPWKIMNENGELRIFRNTKEARVGIMPPRMAKYFNRIDIGIFLCILEICMAEKGILAMRELFPDDTDFGDSLVAKYKIESKAI